MKKMFIQPQVRVVTIETENCMLASSPGSFKAADASNVMNFQYDGGSANYSGGVFTDQNGNSLDESNFVW